MPLFMKDLPKEADGADESTNFTALDALQSLTFDGTPNGMCGAHFILKRYLNFSAHLRRSGFGLQEAGQ